MKNYVVFYENLWSKGRINLSLNGEPHNVADTYSYREGVNFSFQEARKILKLVSRDRRWEISTKFFIQVL